MTAVSLICPATLSRVSSVLNREVKQFGKKYMFDGNEETCWNSDQGSIQWLMLEFPQTVKISQIQIQFQGGFGSRKCALQGKQSPETILDKLKISFENSTDFFGRIIVYRFEVLGEKL
ncbi:hypothetical protein lerEdw1_008567 [Lerista edwardsae]|nr:hypothetical protein lerEdw1_008567 [Lerista edwardsae]